MNELKICVVGGSNSLMANGYIPPLVEILETSTDKTVSLHNFAIGGTFSHFGLWQLLVNPEYRSADIIIVEYALNDAELFNWRLSQNWALAYEGLLRKLRTEAPQALIICPLLYSRSSALRDKLCVPAAQVCYINHRYGVATIDVNARFAGNDSKGSSETQEDWYKDASHYTKEKQNLISQFLADEILGGTGNDPAKDPAKGLPLALSSQNFCDARSAMQEGIIGELFGKGVEKSVFSNSISSCEAYMLQPGMSVSFELKGQVVAFIMVSTRDDGVVRYSFGDREFLSSARRKALDRNEKFSFLMNNFVPDQFFKQPVSHSEVFTPISVEVLTRVEMSETDPSSVLCRPNSRVPAADQENLSFGIVDIVFTGEIKPLYSPSGAE